MIGKKSQAGPLAMSFYGMMIGIMVWIAFTQLLGPTTDAVQDARSVRTEMGVSGLDCSNSSISDGTKATCVMTDFMVFGWAGAVIAGIIGAVGFGVWSLKNNQN